MISHMLYETLYNALHKNKMKENISSFEVSNITIHLLYINAYIWASNQIKSGHLSLLTMFRGIYNQKMYTIFDTNHVCSMNIQMNLFIIAEQNDKLHPKK